MSKRKAIDELIEVMARLRAPEGCPWDQEQSHMSIRLNAVEEVYELVDAIESNDDEEMLEELGDLLLQVVFHAQMAKERKAFNFDDIARVITEKLIRRHPHVFDDANVEGVADVWDQWDSIKKKEKEGTAHERKSAFDGIPRHLPALMQAFELVKKARKCDLLLEEKEGRTKADLGAELFELVQNAQSSGWQAEELLRQEVRKQENILRNKEKTRQGQSHA
ncbi:MAG: MazG family protein [Verrucomicrobiota bacterium]|nr:MazG family protein [Verrucomicrobiota bacterium]